MVTCGIYKKQVVLFLALLTGLLVCTASVVVYYDPLWCTGFMHKGNRITPVIDGRLQKTSRLFHGSNDYDALLIGSSRVEQFRQEDFAPLRVFNYAAPSMYPDEYKEYIDLFLRCNKRKTQVVFLGLDFYGTNARTFEHAKPPSYYIETCSSPLYPLRTFFSGDSLKYSVKMARDKRDQFNYDRLTLDKVTKVVTREESDRLLLNQLAIYEDSFYGKYGYNQQYRHLLQELKERYGQVRFVAFTTPVTTELFRVLVAKGRLGDYERWLEDIVAVFGDVYNLMLPGRFAADRRNFLDAHHMYPDKAAPVVRLICGKSVQADDSIGCYVTRKTLGQHLAAVHKAAQSLMADRIPGGTAPVKELR